MTTDTKAVARFYWAEDEMQDDRGGDYVLFTDHERVVGQLRHEAKGLSQSLTETFTSEEELRTALAASRAEVEGLAKDAERYRWLRDHAGRDDDLVEIFIDQESYAPGHLDAQVDAAMENNNV